MRINQLFLIVLLFLGHSISFAQSPLTINENEYFETQGLNVHVFNDTYIEGHQGGIVIIQHDSRLASNGDIRLEPAPGQWQPFSKMNEKQVDPENKTISASLSYPDSGAINRKFNPIIYPDLHFDYNVRVVAENNTIRVIVDLENPLPEEWIGKAGFILELFPGAFFGHTYDMDGHTGLFPRQLNGPVKKGASGNYEAQPLAEGKVLNIAPDSEKKHFTIEAVNGTLELIDGRAQHNNGWFNVRSEVPSGATKNAIEWVITPDIIPDYKYEPVIHTSQVGFYPDQPKSALIEIDKGEKEIKKANLIQITPEGKKETLITQTPENWGDFEKYRYLKFDFSETVEPGIYQVKYDGQVSNTFRISGDIYDRHVWQPTLEYFLPVQMCHMRVNDRYRVWHGLCHMDDALMAPTDTVHFDGYWQGSSTLTDYKPYEHVPGLNAGGWHDAGDFDLRVESQAGTVYTLSLIYENFGIDYDETTIDQSNHLVELHQPDGKPDILQQIEHGAIHIVNGYKRLGRLYRGVICNDLSQYVLIGDAAAMTNNLIYGSDAQAYQLEIFEDIMDDRWVFTEENPRRALQVSGRLATANRALKGYNDTLATQCLEVAEALWDEYASTPKLTKPKISTLVELILTTGKQSYKDQLLELEGNVMDEIDDVAWSVSRILGKTGNKKFDQKVRQAIEDHYKNLVAEVSSNPFGVAFHPRIWGAAWGIQQFGLEQYFLYKSLDNETSKAYVLNALNYVLGYHPGSNPISFASGVGTESALVAYGLNRADWSYIPGGVISGTSYIKPDFPELKTWPFFWQQGEYVIGGGATNYMFLVLAARDILNDK